MDLVETLIKTTIYDWVKDNFGESEADDPSWNIEALAKVIGKNRYGIYSLMERAYVADDLNYELENLADRGNKVELTDEQKSRVVDMYMNSDAYGAIDHESWEYFINLVAKGE